MNKSGTVTNGYKFFTYTQNHDNTAWWCTYYNGKTTNEFHCHDLIQLLKFIKKVLSY